MASPPHISKAVIAITAASCDEAVVEIARDLAHHEGAEVCMLRVDPPAGVNPGQKLAWLLSEDEGANRMAAAASDTIEPVEQKILSDSVRWLRVESLDPTRAVLQFAAEERVDLLVMETHVSQGLARSLFGGTQSEIARWSDCSVLSVPRSWARSHRGHGFRNILAPVDFSELSGSGLRAAVRLADQYDCSVATLFVVEEPVVPRLRGGRMRREIRRARPDAKRRARAALRSFCKSETERARQDISFRIRSGNAPSMILDFAAEADTDLIVISSHGLSGASRYALGSVCDRVLRRAECPVLVVRPNPQLAADGR